MKIRTAIFGVYVAASAVGFAVLMHFILAEVRPRYVNGLRGDLKSSAELLAATIETLPNGKGLGAGMATPRLRLRILGADGAVLYDSREPVPEAESEYSERGLAKRAATRWLDEAPVDEETERTGEIRGSAPFTLADGRAALLVLSRPVRSVNAVIWSERKKLAGASLLVAGVMLVAGWWLAAQLTRSLEKLTAYAQDVRDGRPATAPASRAQEVATLTRAFEEMRDALEGRQHAERYTRALAHEVKAPLTAIRGAAELLDEEMSAEQRSRFLDNIRGESARIQRIVERLLELTSVEARKVLAQPEVIAADALAAEVAEGLRAAGEAARVGLRVEAAAGANLRGERFLLGQALLNLLQNALEFSPAGAVVVLRVARDGARVRFTIEDDGPGVPDYALGRVFERFYSLPRPGTGRKSTGIGLALVREVAHLHGGEVTLENRSEGGARATLWVPVAGG